MADQELKAKLTLEASASGGGEIEALARELEALAREGGEAAPKFDALAQSLRHMADQDALVAQFARLSRQAQDSARAMDAASAVVDKLGQELGLVGEAAAQAGAAQAQAGVQLRELAQQDGAITAFRNLQADTAKSAQALKGAECELANYKAQLGEGALATREQADALVRLGGCCQDCGHGGRADGAHADLR